MTLPVLWCRALGMSDLPHALTLASLFVSSRSGRGCSGGGGGGSSGGGASSPVPPSPTFLQHASAFSLALSSAALGALPTFYCAVCMERHTEAEGITLEHCPHRFCREGLRGYIETKLSGPRVRILCMSPGCHAGISESNARAILAGDAEALSRLERFFFSLRDQDARECPACKLLQHGSAAAPDMECSECHTHFCFVHSGAHAGSSCAAYESSIAAEERQSAALLGEGKPCHGRGCGLLIVKSEGWCVLPAVL